ncbi:hypothetical protein ACI65C_010597 [Semiaphis heraclei]
MPQDVNLAAYGKQFSSMWPSFRVEMDCGDDGSSVVNATAMLTCALIKRGSANGETQDSVLSTGADEKNSSTSDRPNTFVGQCVAYVRRIFSWDFYRAAVGLFFQQIVIFRNRR